MLFQTSAESETRTLTTIGTAAVLCMALGALLVAYNPLGGQPDDQISIAIDTSYVGQGVAKGTQVVMHGIKVGEVTAISSLPAGGVRLNVDLKKKPVSGLTDTMDIDFRPVNYFGVTGINLIAGSGGKALGNGLRINKVPKGNFTLQALLSRLGELSTGVLTPQLIQVIDTATRYTDALNPMIETALMAANAVAKAQTVPTVQLLRNATGLSVVFPTFVDALTDTGNRFYHSDVNYMHASMSGVSEDRYKDVLALLDEVSNGIFGAVGKLESSHVSDLLPVVTSVKLLSDVVPPLIRPEGIAGMLTDLRSRFERMYAGTPEERALQVRIVLDSLPGVAAPILAIGGQ
jgi:hypothetical protein